VKVDFLSGVIYSADEAYGLDLVGCVGDLPPVGLKPLDDLRKFLHRKHFRNVACSSGRAKTGPDPR